MNVMKLVALALAAGLMMVGCDSKTEAPATTETETPAVVEQVAPEVTEEVTETETETETETIVTEDNATIN